MLRDVPREPVAACAKDCADALDIFQPDSARARELCTLDDDALADEVFGENELLALAALTEPAVLALWAAALDAEADALLGALRAAVLPVADWAMDCEEA